MGIDSHGLINIFNRQAEKVFGYPREEVLGKPIEALLPSRLRGVHIQHRETYSVEPRPRAMGTGLKICGRRKDGTEFPADISLCTVEASGGANVVAFVRDITDRRRAEETYLRSIETFKALVLAAPDAVVAVGPSGVISFVNSQAESMFGYAADELVGMSLERLLPDGVREKHVGHRAGFFASPRARSMGACLELHGVRKDGRQFPVDVSLTAVRTDDGDLLAAAFIRDITLRKAADAELARSREALSQAQRIGHVGSWDWDIVKDEASWSPEMFRIFGLEPAESGGDLVKALTMMHPDDRDKVAQAVKAAVDGTRPYDVEYRIVRQDGSVRFLVARGEVYRDEAGKPLRMIGAVHDLTERSLAEQRLMESREELADKAAELHRSNAELEQFAYVASHDLQEPLRMVASYVQLIERRYKGKLDADADVFINFAAEGSNRMQALIQDLLTYSRVGSRGKEVVETSLDEALQQAIENLGMAIEDAHAAVKRGALPKARADPGQVVQVFQNLIGNAIKFHGADPPTVDISGMVHDGWCEIVVKDNGIGIDPKYFERIFVIFQRLHPRDEYAGTGIGLAVCRRIVDRHGGRIWVDSSPGRGAAFHFTLPSWDKKGGTKR